MCPILCRLLCPWNFLGKNARMGCHFLFWKQCIPRGIHIEKGFPTEGSNPCLLCFQHWQTDSLPLYQLGSTIYTYIHICIYMYMYMYIYMHIYISFILCSHTHTHLPMYMYREIAIDIDTYTHSIDLCPSKGSQRYF